MISSITLKGVGSYPLESPVTIETNNKRVNIFYGLNGSGKSTIGRFLQDSKLEKYKDCSIEPNNQQEILVYNHDFVINNFYKIPDMPGVFTLSQRNKEAEEAMQQALDNKEMWQSKEKNLITEIEQKETEKTKKELDLKNLVWEAKKEYNNSVLKFCLEGNASSKIIFLEKVKRSIGPANNTIEQLKKEAEKILGDDVLLKQNIENINFEGDKIETDTVLSEVILGSKNSYLSDLIDNLGNSDWVKQGVKYIQLDNQCPFCQQNLSESLVKAIHQLFDKTYSDKIDYIEQLYFNYESLSEDLGNKLKAINDKFEKDTQTYEFESKKSLLLITLQDNLNSLQRKKEQPSEVINLKSTTQLISDLNLSLTRIQRDIDIFNNKVKNKKTYKEEIKHEFWRVLNNRFKLNIDTTEKDVRELEKEKQKILILKTKYKNNIKIEDNKFKENQKKVTNLEASRIRINKKLEELGLCGFSIEKTPENNKRYKVVRNNNQDNDVYKSLSEGEKTIITFLYFLELISGAKNDTSIALKKNRIVVIDDPISSLSHNYVYDIAALIHDQVIEESYKQIFLFTHNLFFFHELLLLKSNNNNSCPKGYKLYRVLKSNHSCVCGLQRNEIQNDYQMYWQVIKDSAKNPNYANMLPNAMRNILEHCCNFLNKTDNLKRQLKVLGETESEFKPLYRYINRESHSDAINLRDLGKIDVNRYIEKFKDIFDKMDLSEHYKSMMGI